MSILQNMFSTGAVIMAMLGAAALANKMKGGVPIVGGTAALADVYWFDVLDKLR